MREVFEAVGKLVCTIVVGVAIVFVFAVLVAFPVMWLWNWVIPDIFGLPTITFWQAFGLNLLCGLFFRGVGNIKKKDDKK